AHRGEQGEDSDGPLPADRRSRRDGELDRESRVQLHDGLHLRSDGREGHGLKAAPLLARPLAVAHLTALDVAPVPWVRLAAGAGFDAVGLRMHPAVPGGVAYPMASGSAALHELRDALAGEGIAVHDVEFISFVPALDPAS